MFVRIIEDGRNTADVLVDGKPVARINRVTASWRDFTDQPRIGRRWIPAGSPDNLPGPTTKGEAALIALVNAGYDPEDVLSALLIRRYRPVAAV